MDIDALIEQLAFGKTSPKLSSCLGLYLSPEMIYLSEVHFEKGRPIVDHLVRVPVPAATDKPGPTAAGATTLATDFLNDNSKILALVRQAMSQTRWNSKAVVVTLSHHLGLVRYFTMPQVERRFWAMAVPMEAKKYIPIPFDALNHDFQVIPVPPGNDGKPRQGALIAVTPKKNLVNIKSLLDGLGLTLLGVEVAPCSVLRMWNALDGGKSPDPFCHVHFDGGSTRIIISDKGIPVFFREVFLGPEASIQESRKVDLGGCVSFAQKQLNVAKLTSMRLSGTPGNMPGWQEIATKEAGTAAVLHDTPALLGIKGGDWAGFASIGSAMRFLAPTHLTIDLLDSGRISETDKKTVKYTFLLAAIISSFLLGISLLRWVSGSMMEQELRKYKRDPDIEAIFLNKKPDEIEKMLGQMRDQIDLLRVMDGKTRIKMVDILKEILNGMSDRVWLTSMSISEPIKGNIDGNRELNLSGHTSGASAVEEQDLAFEFRDRLKKSTLLAKLYPDIEVSVEASKLEGLEESRADQEQYKRRLEDRTTFHLVGKFRKK